MIRDRIGNRTRVVLALITLLLTALPPDPGSAQGDAAQELVDRYTPVAYLRDQTAPCDRDGEGYFPAPVESVLGNPDVALKIADTNSSRTDTIIKMGPTAADIAGLDNTHYLDFPGNARRPGCRFERDFQAYAEAEGLEPTTYAHIVVDTERHRVVIQYWLWYYFNDWNNLHEGDWEVIQVVFDAASIEEALETDPILYAYAQHGGGELATPGDDKLLLEDGHPVIYPAAGSHATHYEQHLFLGWGENGTGFGCDNASSPATTVPLAAVVVPDDPDPAGPFGWIFFEGRWGERQPWEFNGPRTPSATGRWADPVDDLEDWRDSSLKVPASNLLGPSVTGPFCDLSAAGAVVVAYFDTHRTPILLAAAAILIAFLVLIARYWSSIGGSIAFYSSHWRTFLGIGLMAVPIGLVFNGLQFLLDQTRPGKWLVSWFESGSGTSIVTVALASSFQYLAIVLFVVPALLAAIRDIQRGRQPGVVTSYRQAFKHLRPIAVALVIVTAAASLLAFSVIGLAVAVWLLVRWQFYPQAIVLDGEPGAVEALTRSVARVRGHWWATLAATILFQVLILLPGPLVGLVMLVVAETGAQFANLVSGLLYAITVPVATIGLTLLYQRWAKPSDGETRVIGHAGD